MEAAQTIENKLSFPQLLRTLGPGIMMAAACVGGSHLVASTKAGAIYGWKLVALILLVNLFKYPFFRTGVQYTMGTGESLIEGYAKLGRSYLWLFVGLTTFSAVINTAALTLFSASLLAYFIPFQLSMMTLSVIVILLSLALLFANHYKTLDIVSKVIMVALTLATLTALAIAIEAPKPEVTNFISPSPWTVAAIGFLVVTMGWMPAPIEISSITSMWLKQQRQHQHVTSRSALFDFNVGYIGTALLAIVFLALGAILLHGNGVELSKSGIGFSKQLVSLYASTIGEWSHYLIAAIAFFAIFGSTITVIDGYAKAISESQRLLRNKEKMNTNTTRIWMLLISGSALAILMFWISALLPMLDFAMTMAFTTTPFFALLNYILVKRTTLPKELTMSRSLNWLAISGLAYLFGFLGLFIWWKF